MKKRLFTLILTVIMIINVFCVASASENNEITVLINGSKVNFDVAPSLINNRTMVPLRAIFEALGATVEWNGDTKTVKSSKDGTTIELTIDNNVMNVNNTPLSLDSPACLIDGRTLVPVRAISEAFGTTVDWDADARQVIITTDSFKYSGYGNKVIQNINIPAGYYYAVYSHDGERNFITHLYYGDSSKEYVTNGIGVCTERTALELMQNRKIENGYLEVKADGAWAIEIIPVSGTTTTNISGCGETVTGVFTATESNNVITLTHDGERNFITHILPFGGGSTEYVTNEIGPYNAQRVVQLKPGRKYYIHIKADGNWTVDFGKGDSLTSYPAPSLSLEDVSKDCVHQTTHTPGTKATCTQDGITDEERCIKCGLAIKEAKVIKAYGHKYVDGKCSRCDESDPDYCPEFELGDTWTVSGQFRVTVDSVDVHKHCNSVSDLFGEDVIIINYTYENIGYENPYDMDGLFIASSSFDVYDESGEAASLYPCTHEKYAKQISKGKKCSASEAYVIFNQSDEITLEISEYIISNGEREKVRAEFTLPLDDNYDLEKNEDEETDNAPDAADIYEITDNLQKGVRILETTETTATWLILYNRDAQTPQDWIEIVSGIRENASKALPYFEKAMQIADGITFSNDRLQGMLDSLYDECKILSETEDTGDEKEGTEIEFAFIAVHAKASAAYKVFSDMK